MFCTSQKDTIFARATRQRAIKFWLNLLINSSLFQIYFFASKKKGFIFAPLLFLKQRKIYVH